jgi:hypothetical protein
MNEDMIIWRFLGANVPESRTGPVAEKGEPKGGGWEGCFIATAAYGSYMADDVMALRKFRDDYLMANTAGRALAGLYYRLSPPAADFIASHSALRVATRAALAAAIHVSGHPLATGMLALTSCIAIIRARKRRR